MHTRNALIYSLTFLAVAVFTTYQVNDYNRYQIIPENKDGLFVFDQRSASFNYCDKNNCQMITPKSTLQKQQVNFITPNLPNNNYSYNNNNQCGWGNACNPVGNQMVAKTSLQYTSDVGNFGQPAQNIHSDMPAGMQPMISNSNGQLITAIPTAVHAPIPSPATYTATSNKAAQSVSAAPQVVAALTPPPSTTAVEPVAEGDEEEAAIEQEKPEEEVLDADEGGEETDSDPEEEETEEE